MWDIVMYLTMGMGVASFGVVTGSILTNRRNEQAHYVIQPNKER